ncbi:hypothetical protein [Cohnella hashimotonis]|uniref:Uncharacterized protein n=1 Tax=Cohnella hashimotonis TaxID=2826895 RepID=A0ABT6TGL8_9BACL|nr:hypothetical protein [Cohnella hashimotonis]MDI4645860.1 hypothetical protein [Cohnella hashimotonis]
MTTTIYVNTSSYNFWWGVYGMESLTGWEDIVLYKDSEQNEKLLALCVCTKNYLRNAVQELKDDPDEADFVQEIQTFLVNDKIVYHYFYDRPEDEDFYELPFNKLPRNAHGIYPRSLELWYPSEGIHEAVIESSVRELCREYLELDIGPVSFIEPIGKEEALKAYVEHIERFSGNAELVFTEELIASMMNKMSITREDVVKLLDRSV